MTAAADARVLMMRPFLPAKDMDVSRAFYEALDFVADPIDDDLILMTIGSGDEGHNWGFILQNYYVRQWAENSMMHVFLDRLDPWWEQVVSLDLPARFGVQAPRPPAVQPWGLRIAYVWDPVGVLWHFAERTAE